MRSKYRLHSYGIDGIFSGFCNDNISKGDFVHIVQEGHAEMVKPYTGKEVTGISMHDVININLREGMPGPEEVQLGGKINVLHRGIVIMKVKGDDLPLLTPVYLTKKGNLSYKKKSRPYIGKTLSSQDEEGYCQVEVNI